MSRIRIIVEISARYVNLTQIAINNTQEMLQVACGTGKHIPYLKDSFSIIATDYSKKMLTLARKRVPDVTFKQADMIHLNLNKKFDVIICLFGSIGYVKNYKNLNKGGVVIIAKPHIVFASYHKEQPDLSEDH